MFSRKGLNKLWYIQTTEHCTAIRNDLIKVYFIPMEKYFKYMVQVKNVTK